MRLQEGATRPAVERQRTKGRGAPEKILSPGSLRLRLRLSHVQSSSESGRPCSSIRRTNRTFSTTRASASLEQPAPILLGFLGLSDLLCLFVRKAAPGPRSLRHPQQACRAPSYVRHCTWKATFPTKQASGPDLSTQRFNSRRDHNIQRPGPGARSAQGHRGHGLFDPHPRTDQGDP